MSKPAGRSGSGGRPPASAPANFPASSAAPARVAPPARTATGQPPVARPAAGAPPAKPTSLTGAVPPPPGALGTSASSPAATPGRRPETLRPQGHLQLAAQHARRHAPPTGVGLDTAPVRQRMVERLRADGVRCEPVLQAMLAVPRHRFVDSALAIQAYEDTSLPIGLGQTISKPSVVARMIEWLFLGEAARQRGHLGRMLEIGTGCGYQTALLAQMASHVLSVERLKPLHDLAATHLGALQVPRIRLVYGDGMRGHPPNAPYDSILAAAGGDDLPQAWLDQLAPGGRLVAPTSTPGGRGQVLLIVDRTPEGLRRTFGEAVQFVPLKSGTN